MTKAILITAADDQYFSLAEDWLQSMTSHSYDVNFDIGMLDVGLSEVHKDFFIKKSVKVVPVESDIDFPARDVWEKAKPGMRTLTARPSLRRYFPGYDVYVWIDADIWIQTPEAINTLIENAAKNQAIHLVCEWDRCYGIFFQNAGIWQVFRDWYQTNFGPDIAAQMTLKPMLNAGVFAMRQDAPGWDAWHTIYRESLQKVTGLTDQGFMADQLGLNILIYQKKIPVCILPASYNWMTFYALPKYDPLRNLYVEPLPPYRPLSQIHLTKKIKEQTEKIQKLDGHFMDRPLTYRAQKAGI